MLFIEFPTEVADGTANVKRPSSGRFKQPVPAIARVNFPKQSLSNQTEIKINNRPITEQEGLSLQELIANKKLVDA